jgi:tRNA nucleotidyltransferase/poly(A) polymerase
MLLSERPARALQLLDEAGLFELLLPELHRSHGVEQAEHPRADVFWHTLYLVDGTEADLVHRLAPLFHEVGKPLTRCPAAPSTATRGRRTDGPRCLGSASPTTRWMPW